MCKSCAMSLRPVTWTKPKEKLCVNQGAYKSYTKAKRRVAVNHKGAYGHVEFRFSSYEQFFEELGPRPEGMTLDRIDPNGHYEPGNVRWATHKTQCRNKRDNAVFNYQGKKMCLVEICEITGINRGTVTRRIKRGVPEELLFVKGRVDIAKPMKTIG
jgi:hypothetical protein